LASEKKQQESEQPATKKALGRPPASVPTFPRDSLKEALRVAEAIRKDGAGASLAVPLLANSMNLSRRSKDFESLLRSSERYGLTDGSIWSKEIVLKDLGRAIVAPTDDAMVGASLRTALLTPDLFAKFYGRYDQKSIPREAILKNVLEQNFGVRKTDIDECYILIMKNIDEQGLKLQQKNDTLLWLDNLGKASSTQTQGTLLEVSEGEGQLEEALPSAAIPAAAPLSAPQKPKQIFVAHGKNKKPLEQLKGILNQFKVTFKVAMEEPNKGKVIPQKVLDLMHECTSGIFIFTADEILTDSDGKQVIRPNDNVVFELGAGVALYGEKIVILREEGMTFGSDFESFVRISFSKDNLDAQGLAIMKELIGMGFLSVNPT
jgi:predicted nucleotide-binding protein